MRYKIDRNHKITRFLCLLLGMILLTGSMCIPVYAAEYWPEGPEVVSPNVIVMEASTGTVLYDRDSLEAHYPASITKIMTTLIALENSDLNDIVTFSDAAIDTEGSGIARDYGEQMTMEQCLYAVMLASANECAYAVAEHVGGTIENFVAMMNEKAKELGCQNTHFANPHGLHDENHYTTAYDIYLMFQEALKYDAFQEIIGSSEYYSIFIRDNDKYGIMWQSTNYYHIGEATPPQDVEVIGGKTGTTDEAGSCLCLLAKDKYGDSHVSIILNAGDKETLYAEMNKLLSKINN